MKEREKDKKRDLFIEKQKRKKMRLHCAMCLPSDPWLPLPFTPDAAFEADNTVRETKNGCCMKMMCTLLQKQKLALGGFFFPRVGHSHGSLGALATSFIWPCCLGPFDWLVVVHQLPSHTTDTSMLPLPCWHIHGSVSYLWYYFSLSKFSGSRFGGVWNYH